MATVKVSQISDTLKQQLKLSAPEIKETKPQQPDIDTLRGPSMGITSGFKSPKLRALNGLHTGLHPLNSGSLPVRDRPTSPKLRSTTLKKLFGSPRTAETPKLLVKPEFSSPKLRVKTSKKA
ncbi:hypothetical protein FIBSPDRAFT_893067 [Athelia psychrophila]|uniref:Uncharacterized protein n=1 Tax=Athelia psychrophila TaxID=1759441 RepID=A0A166HP28_9AGAM|nr:hypothetical protein FIBSPDRAFT_893067 [Fibularhizoctonia sp. CBS 109695]